MGTLTDATLPGGDAAVHGTRALAIGTRIEDRYRITRFIGEGGMGEVYAAEDHVLGTTVALKTLRPELAGSTVAIERFRREIRLARQVSHPNVCRLHDVGVVGGSVFLTMELLEGRTLAEELRETGPFALDVLEEMAAQLVAGLDALHAAGIVHRDFKTANVMVVKGPTPRLVIMDFGLARSVDDTSTTLTSDTGLLGTPAYMAPEQVEGGATTPASDIYALGVVLYELATRSLPFGGDNALAIATARLGRAAPRASASRRELAGRWDEIIARCLARDPSSRFASVRDVLGPRRPRRRWLAIAGVVIAAAAAVGGTIALGTPSSDAAARPARSWPSGLRPSSPDAAVRFDQAQGALDEDRVSEARDALEQAARSTASDPIAHAALAEVLETLGHEDRAREEIDRAKLHAATLGDEARWFVDAIDAQVHDDERAAIAPLQRLVAALPSKREYALRLAAALANAGELDTSSRMLANLGAGRSDAERIELDLIRATVARQRGELDDMRRFATAAVDTARITGRPHDEADGLILLASAQWLSRDTASAAHTYQRAVEIGHTGAVVRARAALISLDLAAGRIASAATRSRENAALVRELGDRRALVELLTSNVWYQADVGRPADAAADLVEARALATKLGDQAALATIELGEGILAYQRGDLATAVTSLEAAYGAGERLGETGLVVSAYHNLMPVLEELDDPAHLARARDRLSSAAERQVESYLALRDGDLDRAERIARSHADRLTYDGREALLVIAEVALRRGQLAEAATQIDDVGPMLVGDGTSIAARDRLTRVQAELHARRGDLASALALLDRQASDCEKGSLVYCQIANQTFAVLLAASRDRAEAERRAPHALALARARGYRRSVREIELALRR